MRIGYVFELWFSAGKIEPISMIFGILDKDGQTLRNWYLFYCEYKKMFEMSAYVLTCIFTKNVINFETLRQIFLQLQQISRRVL